MADSFFPSWLPSGLNAEFSHKESVLAEIGDLCYYDASDARIKPASSFADAGSAAATQLSFASVFGGISSSKFRASDATARPAMLEIDCIKEFPCASATFVVGDYVTPTYTAGVLSNQALTKTTDKGLAIGKVVKAYSSATTKVKVRFTSPIFCGLVVDGGGTPKVRQPTPTAKTTSATLTAAEIGALIVTGTHSAGATQTYTLPTGTLMSAYFLGMPIDGAFDWSLINLSAAAADTITVAAGTDHTIVGGVIVQSAHSTTGTLYGNAVRFRSRKTAATTWVTYRLAG